MTENKKSKNEMIFDISLMFDTKPPVVRLFKSDTESQTSFTTNVTNTPIKDASSIQSMSTTASQNDSEEMNSDAEQQTGEKKVDW